MNNLTHYAPVSIFQRDPSTAAIGGQQDIRQRMDQHTASIARLQQQRTIHKAALGVDVKKLAVVTAGTLVLAVTAAVWIIAES